MCDGGTVNLVWTITDLCDTITFDADFILIPPVTPDYTAAADTTAYSCSYANQGELDAAFSAWRSGVENNIGFSNGCDPQITLTTDGTAPGLCDGGTVNLVWTITDLCDTITFDADFIVNVPPAVDISCPTDPNIPACTSQTDIEAAYNAWIAGFTFSGGCSSTDNVDEIPALPADAYDNGADLTFTYVVTDLCDTLSCTAIFTVEPDTVAPTFTAQPYQNCVDPLHWAVYDELNPTPVAGHVDPNLNKSPVDYRTMYAGDTFLDLTDLADNCCATDELTINWRIDFADTPDPITGAPVSHPSISGTGQPSTYGSDILLWGDGVTFNTVYHTITYWVEDCHENVSEEVEETITIRPRPRAGKIDY